MELRNEGIFIILLTIYGQIEQLTIFYVLKGYNGNCISKLLFSLKIIVSVSEWGCKYLFGNVRGFLFLCLKVRGVLVIFPLI